MTVSSESKRIKQFRLGIAKAIPKFPNDAKTLAILEAKSLGSLLIDYVNWAYRRIPPRPRKVTIEPTLTVDPRWKALAADTKALLERVRNGEDINPNLSLKAFYNGFTPASSSAATPADKWEDKDFFLTTTGYHHLHLSALIEAKGYAKRTDVVLFAQVTRDNFNAIGLFDHTVFESADASTKTMTAERERLWGIYEYRNSFGREPGKVYISNPIATSGHSIFSVRLAGDYARIVDSVDQKIDDLSSRLELFKDLPYEKVSAKTLEWNLNYLDLGLHDKKSSVFYVLRYGPI